MYDVNLLKIQDLFSCTLLVCMHIPSFVQICDGCHFSVLIRHDPINISQNTFT